MLLIFLSILIKLALYKKLWTSIFLINNVNIEKPIISSSRSVELKWSIPIPQGCPTVLELFNFIEWPDSTRNQQEIGLDPRFAGIYTFSMCVHDVDSPRSILNSFTESSTFHSYSTKRIMCKAEQWGSHTRIMLPERQHNSGWMNY